MNFQFSYFRIWIAAILTVAGAESVSAQSTNHGGAKDFSAFQIINDRNIFDPHRRPRTQQRNTAPVQKIVDSFSLVGTMSYSNLLLAFFDGTTSDYRKSMPVGGKIATYTATEINPNWVKLVSGTNEVVLKVGMQMRRSEDGNWTATDAPVNAYTSNGRSSSSNERRSENGRNRTRTYNSSSRTSRPENSGNEMPPPNTGVALPMPPGNLDPTDPVVRLMMRRQQEEGGGVPPGPGNDQQPENPPGENSPNDNPDTNTNAPGDTNPNPNAQPERQ